ncbi:hypothetical protein LG325_13325 [Marinobacter nauticus]
MPVVPAVVLIERLARSLEEKIGQRICSIRQLRLLGLIEPGHCIDVEAQEKGADSWRLTCQVAGKPVAKGAFSCASAQDAVAMAASASPSDYQEAAPAYQQLPHSGSMQLIDDFAMFENGAETEVTLAEQHPLADSEGVPAWAMLEYAAQLMACRKVRMGGEAMSKAVIVLVRSLQCPGAQKLSPGSDLGIRVMEEVAQPGAVQCLFSATSGGQLVASGEFTVLSEA